MATSTIKMTSSIGYPDYSNKIATYQRGGANPFTIPQDGWLIGYFDNVGAGGYSIYVTINNVAIETIGSTVPQGQGVGNVFCPVKAGDVVTVRMSSSSQGYNIGLYGIRP